MVNNKMLIDSKLIELKDYIDQILDPNYYSNKINDNLKIRTLNITVNSFISSLSEQIKSLPQIDYLSNQINDLINSLDDKYKQVNFQSLNPRMQNARKTAWKNIKNEFNKSNSVLVDLLHNESLEIDTKFSDVVLTRNEVVLLITYLR